MALLNFARCFHRKQFYDADFISHFNGLINGQLIEEARADMIARRLEIKQHVVNAKCALDMEFRHTVKFISSYGIALKPRAVVNDMIRKKNTVLTSIDRILGGPGLFFWEAWLIDFVAFNDQLPA